MTHSGYAPALIAPVATVSPFFFNREAGRLRPVPPLDRPSASHSPLLALAPGPTQVVCSSRDRSWPGVLLEQHRTAPGERPATTIDRPVLVMLCRRPARLDYRTGSGGWRPNLQRPDTLTVLPAGLIPEMRLQTPAEFLYCAFEDSLLHRVAEELECIPYCCPVFQVGLQDRSITHLLYLLLEELGAEVPHSPLYVDSLRNALASSYLMLSNRYSQSAQSWPSALPPHLLNRVREKIEANLHTHLSVASLAGECGYSRAHFLRLFQAATGLTPHQYILELRLKRAQECLRRKEANLIDIAALCGFSSQSHMTSVFRQRLHLTPAEFRRYR